MSAASSNFGFVGSPIRPHLAHAGPPQASSQARAQDGDRIMTSLALPEDHRKRPAGPGPNGQHGVGRVVGPRTSGSVHAPPSADMV